MDKSLFLLKEKVFSFFKKYFIHEIESYEDCVNCGKKLTGSQRKFCSKKCLDEYWRKQYAHPYKPIMTKKLIKIREKYKNNVGGIREKKKAQRIAMKKYPSLKGIKCQVCKEKPAVHRHHEDYDKPLDILFVCWECHGKIHADINTDERRFK